MDLYKKAHVLKTSQYFSGYRNVQKQVIFLALTGVKRSSSAISGKEVDRKLLPDDEAGVRVLLERLGLAYKIDPRTLLSPGEFALTAYVSLNQSGADSLYDAEVAEDTYAFGLAAGFPKSAVEAWRDGTLLSFEREAALYAEAGAQNNTDFFRLSQQKL